MGVRKGHLRVRVPVQLPLSMFGLGPPLLLLVPAAAVVVVVVVAAVLEALAAVLVSGIGSSPHCDVSLVRAIVWRRRRRRRPLWCGGGGGDGGGGGHVGEDHELRFLPGTFNTPMKSLLAPFRDLQCIGHLQTYDELRYCCCVFCGQLACGSATTEFM